MTGPADPFHDPAGFDPLLEGDLLLDSIAAIRNEGGYGPAFAALDSLVSTELEWIALAAVLRNARVQAEQERAEARDRRFAERAALGRWRRYWRMQKAAFRELRTAPRRSDQE